MSKCRPINKETTGKSCEYRTRKITDFRMGWVRTYTTQLTRAPSTCHMKLCGCCSSIQYISAGAFNKNLNASAPPIFYLFIVSLRSKNIDQVKLKFQTYILQVTFVTCKIYWRHSQNFGSCSVLIGKIKRRKRELNSVIQSATLNI